MSRPPHCDENRPTTDPEARSTRKGRGKEAELADLGNLLVENREGLIVNTRVDVVTGYSEITAPVTMLELIPCNHQVTVGADKDYDNQTFVEASRDCE